MRLDLFLHKPGSGDYASDWRVYVQGVTPANARPMVAALELQGERVMVMTHGGPRRIGLAGECDREQDGGCTAEAVTPTGRQAMQTVLIVVPAGPVRLAAAILGERFEDVTRQNGAVLVRIRHLETARDVLACCRARGVAVRASCVMSRTAA